LHLPPKCAPPHVERVIYISRLQGRFPQLLQLLSSRPKLTFDLHTNLCLLASDSLRFHFFSLRRAFHCWCSITLFLSHLLSLCQVELLSLACALFLQLVPNVVRVTTVTHPGPPLPLPDLSSLSLFISFPLSPLFCFVLTFPRSPLIVTTRISACPRGSFFVRSLSPSTHGDFFPNSHIFSTLHPPISCTQVFFVRIFSTCPHLAVWRAGTACLSLIL